MDEKPKSSDFYSSDDQDGGSETEHAPEQSESSRPVEFPDLIDLTEIQFDDDDEENVEPQATESLEPSQTSDEIEQEDIQLNKADEPVVNDEPKVELDDGEMIRDLTVRLSTTESGVGYIYDLIDDTVEHFGLTDLLVVVDEAPAGRQIFRAGRKPVNDVWDADKIDDAVVGLYSTPDFVPQEMSNALSHLCSMSMRMDLLTHDAAHDPLTGLMNRRSFERLLDQAVARSERYGWPFALVLLDLNDFKDVNDTYGHDTGDAVLAAIGSELRQELRAGDVAARLGGDEFAIILNEGNPAAVPSLLHRLLDAAYKSGIDVDVGFSYGMALAPTDSVDPHKLFLLADQRLYDAKSEKNEQSDKAAR